MLITDPSVMKSWNPRIKEVVPITLGKPKANAQYRIRYALNSSESNYLAEIMEYEEYSRLVLHLEGGNLPRKGYIQEIYELIPNSTGTLFVQQIMIIRGGLSLPAGLILRIRNLIGRSSGKKYLTRLRGMAGGEV
jgi:hypothetical protein